MDAGVLPQRGGAGDLDGGVGFRRVAGGGWRVADGGSDEVAKNVGRIALAA